MRNEWLSRLRAACIGALLALLALFPQDAMQAARIACKIWANNVLPALFPYMVLSQMLVSGLPKSAFTIPLAMLGGSPASARLIQLSNATGVKAQQLAALCTTASPLFILGTVSGGWRMLLAHWLGALVAFIYVKLLQGRIKQQEGIAPSPPVSPPMGFPESVRDAAIAMLNVCGCMVLFFVLSAMISRLLPLSPMLSAALSCVLEMAGGCARIQALGLPEMQVMPLLCAVISFGGLSVFMQNATYLKPAGVNPKIQLSAKIVHAVAAYGICFLFYLS